MEAASREGSRVFYDHFERMIVNLFVKHVEFEFRTLQQLKYPENRTTAFFF